MRAETIGQLKTDTRHLEIHRNVSTIQGYSNRRGGCQSQKKKERKKKKEKKRKREKWRINIKKSSPDLDGKNKPDPMKY